MHEELKPTEHELAGTWVSEGQHTRGDALCARIEWLTRERLERIASDASGWDTLFRDPHDNRLWELTYPQSWLHGGGPPRLAEIERQAAEAKYSVDHRLTSKWS